MRRIIQGIPQDLHRRVFEIWKMRLQERWNSGKEYVEWTLQFGITFVYCLSSYWGKCRSISSTLYSASQTNLPVQFASAAASVANEIQLKTIWISSINYRSESTEGLLRQFANAAAWFSHCRCSSKCANV
jgi:hypothetical protein